MKPARNRQGSGSRSGSRQGGFTLLELLVATSLLAVLAVIGWRGLDSVLSTRTRIVEVSDDLRALTVAFSQIDEDLRRSWPVRHLGLARPSIGFGIDQGTVTLELLREGGGATDPSRIERIAYRLRGGLLERGFGPLLVVQGSGGDGGTSGGVGTPGAFGASGASGGFGAGTGAAGTGGLGPVAPGSMVTGEGLPLSSAPLVWQPLLAGVGAVQWRAWVRQRGWLDPSGLAMLVASQAVGSTQASGGASGAAAQAGAQAQTGSAATGQAVGQAAGAAGTGAQTPAQAAAAAAAAAAPVITGIELIVLRTDGQRYARVFPVMD